MIADTMTDNTADSKPTGKHPNAIDTFVWCLAAGVFCLLGGFMLMGSNSLKRSGAAYEWPLPFVRQQLTGLAQQLRMYHDMHGRYPSSDAGLAALNEFQVVFAVPARKGDHFPQSLAEFNAPDFARTGSIGPIYLRALRDGVLRHRQHFGTLPENQGDLSLLVFDYLDWMPPDRAPDSTVTIGIDPTCNVYYQSSAGPLSPWLIPYGYENRRDLDPELFDCSPVETDDRKRYSLQVDDGIYVWSAGGMASGRKADEQWWQFYGPRAFGALMILFALGLVVRLFLRSVPLGLSGLLAAVIGFLPGAKAGMPSFSCYRVGPTFSYRSEEMVEQSRRLIEEYHQRGIINQTTYNRAVRVLDNPPDGQVRTSDGGDE